MRAQLLITPILSSFCALVVAYAWLELRAPAVGDSTPTAAERAALEERWRALDARLTALDARLGELELEATARPALAARGRSPSDLSTGADRLGSGDDAVGEEREGAEGHGAGDASERVARLLGAEGGGEALRELVAQVVEEERVARQETQRKRAEERRREIAEMREGPWGRHNLQVNRMAKKLALDDRQTDAYYRLLMHFDEERKALWKNPNGEHVVGTSPDPESLRQHIEQVEQRSTELSRQFDEEFGQFLDDEQLAAYNALPGHERGGGSPMVMSFSSDGGDVFGIAPAAVQVETIVIDDATAGGASSD